MTPTERTQILKNYNIITSHDIAVLSKILCIRKLSLSSVLKCRSFNEFFYIEEYIGYRKVRKVWYKDVSIERVKDHLTQSTKAMKIHFY